MGGITTNPKSGALSLGLVVSPPDYMKTLSPKQVAAVLLVAAGSLFAVGPDTGGNPNPGALQGYLTHKKHTL